MPDTLQATPPAAAPAVTPLTIRMHADDNVAIVANDGGLPAGSLLPSGLVLRDRVPQGHKVALVDIAADAPVLGADAIALRLADPSRLATVESWTTHPNMWTRRAALVITLPYAKMNFPKDADLSIRETALGWAAAYVTDRDWFIQKAVAWWVRDLSKHDATRARAFVEGPGAGLKSFARKEAGRFLP